ncbi:MAG: ABC transporter permease [Acidimicrobiales bacterium]|nr:ABC transporter permease [Acidimicrobiales bacterium]
MSDLLAFTVLGLSAAAVYAIAAGGLVLTYATSGIFNFAHGAIGMLAAFTYWQLRYGWGWPAPLAALVVIGVLAPAFGALLERVVFRGLETAAEVTKVVVSVGVLVACVGLAFWCWPSEARPFPPFFGGTVVDLGPVNVTGHQLLTLVVAVVVAVGLRLALHRLRGGVAMRAVVDHRELLRLCGGRPDRSSMLGWALGSALAAVAGILVAPVLQLSVIPLTLLVVNAYAAAVIGRLRSLPLTFVGAVVVGVAEAYAIGYLPTDVRWLGGVRPAVPVIVLFVALLVLPHARLRPSGARRRAWVPAPSPVAALAAGAVLVAAAVALGGVLSPSDSLLVGRGLGLAIVGLSLVPLVGWAGQLSLCQMSFAAVGALVMAHAGADGRAGGLVLAFLVAGAVGAVVALPAIRLSGIYLALATAAFAVLLDRWVFTIPSVGVLGRRVPLFESGTVTVGRLDLPGVSFESERAQLVLLALVFALLALVVVVLRRGPLGRVLLAVQDSPAACATLGLRLTLTKLGVFALSAGIAGVGGALLGGLAGSVSAQTFGFFESLPVLLMTAVGGIGAVSGALVGGLGLVVFSLFGRLSGAFDPLVVLLPGVAAAGLARDPRGVVAWVVARWRELGGAAVWDGAARAADDPLALDALLAAGAPALERAVGEVS